METTNRGILIAIEGIDGTGKSTQVKLLAGYLRSKGCTVIETREPTDGPFGKKIRQLYTDRGQCTLEEELNLFVEDRRQHVTELVNPSLKAGHVVLTDRYYFSTAAYQGAAGMNPDEVFIKNSFAPEPDMVILLTMKPEVSLKRIQELRGDDLNDFEQEDQLHKVAALFESFKQPCIERIDADASLHEVAARIQTTVDTLLEKIEYTC